jgi:hypothetical protein
MMNRIFRNVTPVMAWLSLSVPLSLVAQEESISTAYTCGASTATLQPPQASPPSLQAVGNNQQAVVVNQQNHSAAKKLTSVCLDGEVPVAVLQDTRYFHKGNPRLGSYPAYGPEHALPSEFVKKYLLRSFEEVYGKGDGNPTQPISQSAIAPSAPAAATPTFSVPAGTYTEAPTVIISDTTPLATIYYTTNGTTPTTSSTVYSGPITVATTETLEAIATASGYSQSAVASAAYIINLTPCNGTTWYSSCYYYANSGESSTANGGGMTLGIELPIDVETGNSGGHSIGELTVEGASSGITDVEMGFNVSLDQYGDSKVHLFVYHWIDGAETCYDTCGWNQYSNTYFPGMDISALTGQQVYMGWVHGQGAWWAWFNDQWLGYISDTEWSGTFTQSVAIQWYGEVATSNGVPPLTQMGNGQFSKNPTSANMSTLCNVDATAWLCNYDDKQSTSSSYQSYYDILNHTSFGAFRYGGSGQTGITAPAVTVTPSSNSISPTQTLSVTIAVNGGSGNPTPTGTAVLSSGSYTSSATTLQMPRAAFCP